VADDLFDVVPRADDAEGSPPAGSAVRETVRLRVHVRPGAGRSAIVGRHGDALAVRVAAPPVDGRANAACAELLEDELGVRDLELVGGERGADKRFELRDVDVEKLRRRLEELIEEAGAHRGAGRRASRSRRR
jgi:uncharacterized protein (TIGR00251 family)